MFFECYFFFNSNAIFTRTTQVLLELERSDMKKNVETLIRVYKFP